MTRRVLASIVCVLGALLPLDAAAYYLETRGSVPDPLRYDDAAPVQFRIGPLSGMNPEADEIAAIEAAFATWGAADCSTLSFEAGPRVTDPNPSHYADGTGEVYILVYFTDDAGLFDREIAGFFAFGHDGAGRLIGGTIALNLRHAAFNWGTTGEAGDFDIQGTVTALIGRSMGITSTMTGNATYPRYAPGDISKRTLGADDLAAISFLYPDGAGCGMDAPEMVCAMDTPDCPPPVGSMMGDGGVPEGDGGTPVLRDSGGPMFMDAGTGPLRDSGSGGGGGEEDEGCSCHAPGAARGGASGGMLALGLAAVLGLAVATRRKRKV